ncbi:hypothetical protein EJ06DRAFT_489936 [Trichodelitschia bisporula]|uniref:RNase III domain-containing protein n=1 Tax=Trichodelitschia bisporula TaxID=703511 RepID=A0A6G1I552_9PEZI|nr:hypothetical protein EJ06DRAFT_489936 [Trichodelitschia bisporula]
MSMPIRVRPKPKNNEWAVNTDPTRLDAMYTSLLGPGGAGLLSEEVKWLAVTHKSFDQGRRGFNDRLSYLGRRIVELQTSLALLAPGAESVELGAPDAHGRRPYAHPALAPLEHLSQGAKRRVLDKTRLAQLGDTYGVTGVMRWRPKKAENLRGSGQEVVVTQTIYAIIGALALEQGGGVANRVVQEKILAPLGVGAEGGYAA